MHFTVDSCIKRPQRDCRRNHVGGAGDIEAIRTLAVYVENLNLGRRANAYISVSDLFQGHHLSGTSALVRSVMGNTIPDCSHGLQEASFWGYFRQCLYVACVNCEPLKFDISIYQIEMRLSTPCTVTLPSAEEESTWCKWITWILAEVVEFCFGPQGPLMTLEEAQSSWRELVSKVDMWECNKPSSFQSIAFLDRDPGKHRLFPLRWFGNEWHGKDVLKQEVRILLRKN